MQLKIDQIHIYRFEPDSDRVTKSLCKKSAIAAKDLEGCANLRDLEFKILPETLCSSCRATLELMVTASC